MSKAGRKPDERRLFYRTKFALTERQCRDLHEWELDVLDRCTCDEARRLLLGVSEKEVA